MGGAATQGRELAGRPGRTWLGWFAAFLLIGVGWAVLTPVNQYPDESDHAYRAVSVVRGEVLPHIGAYSHGTGASTNVPASIVHVTYAGPCVGLQAVASCSTASAPPGWITVSTSEGRNFPLYYALVGLPSLLYPNREGWYLMRLVSAVLCAALLASGATVVMSMRRRPLVLGGAMLAGLTPLALDLSGSINPSGPETASALCFWAVLLALSHDNSVLPRRFLVGLGLSSGIVLATMRDLGWLWVVLAAAGSVASVPREQRRLFLRSGAARLILSCTAGAWAVAEAWSVTFRSYQVFSLDTPPEGLVAAARSSLRALPDLLKETVAYLGDLTVPPPLAADACWVLVAAAVAGIAVAGGRRTALLVLAGAALVPAISLGIEAISFIDPSLGGWQGRYTLPLVVGVPLLCVARTDGIAAERRTVVLLASAAILLALVAQAAVYRGAVAAFAPPPRFWYASLLLATGALAVLVNIAVADRRWSSAARSDVASGAVHRVRA